MKKLKSLIYTIVIFFFGRYIFKNIDIILSLLEINSYVFLYFAFFLLTLAFFIQVDIWKNIFYLNNISLTYLQSIRIYSTAVMTAYIPGKIPGIYLTAKYTNNILKKEKNTFISIIIYQLMSLLSAGLIGFLFLIINLNIDFVIIKIFLMLGVIIFAILFVNPTNYVFLTKLIKKFFKKGIKYKIKGTYIQNIYILSKLAFVWIIISFSINLLNSSIKGYFDFNHFLIFTSIFLFSQILGAIIFILPSGIGIFESSIYYGVQTFISIEDAIRLSVISRLFIIVPAFCVFFIDLIVINCSKKIRNIIIIKKKY